MERILGLQSSGSDFTKSWQSSAFGRFGLVMVGLAFLVAVIVMLQGAFTKKFHRELRLKVRPAGPTVSDQPSKQLY
jgi:hypothetical protein